MLLEDISDLNDFTLNILKKYLILLSRRAVYISKVMPTAPTP